MSGPFMDLMLDPRVLAISFPLLAGFVCMLLPSALDRARALISTASAAILFIFTLAVFLIGRPMLPTDPLFMLNREYLCLRLDHLGSFVLLGIGFFGFIISLYSMGYMKGRDRLREYYAYLLWTLALSCGAVLANDLVLLLVFWGLLGITLYMMAGIGGGDAAAAAKKSFIIIGGSDCLLLLGVVILWVVKGTTRMDVLSVSLHGELSYVAFLCFAVAALAKAGAMPFHSWVPDFGEKAPSSVTAFLPASIDKLLGIYLLARTALHLFRMNTAMNTMLMFVGAGTVICAVMMALVQHDLKRLLSYHAVSQVGYMVLGIGTGTLVGIAGGLFHMLNHAIYKSCLFLCAGSVERRNGTTDLDKLGGLASAMPITFISCFIAALAISGIPPLNGFTSKWMVYQGIIESAQSGSFTWVIWLVAAMMGSALTLASFAKVLHAVFLKKPGPEQAKRKVKEVELAMWLPMVVLAALCILFGVVATRLPLAEMIFPAVPGSSVASFTGKWSAASAAIMLFAAFVLGLLVYLLSNVRKMRACETYVGGERMSEACMSSNSSGAVTSDVEVTGVNFYRTVEDVAPFNRIYAAARAKLFDLYDVGTSAIFYFVEALRKVHDGKLPSYLTWLLVGFLALIWLLVHGTAVI